MKRHRGGVKSSKQPRPYTIPIDRRRSFNDLAA
jgi:hypothetical protein